MFALFKPETRQGYILLCMLLYSIASFLFIQRYIVSTVVVDGNSMEPSLVGGKVLIIEKITPSLFPGYRGQIVVLDDGFGDHAIKRIVGLPGDTIQILAGKVIVDGRPLREAYLRTGTHTDGPRTRFKLGDNQYFVLGDNRKVSYDSRAYGPISGKRIVGRISLEI